MEDRGPVWKSDLSGEGKGLGGDGVRTGAGAVERGGEVGNGRVCVCRVPE